ncbi:MAG: BrnT family toxin [Rhodospirillaceae bacterium]|nr:BrnT family toxin [Rhodospirillaceae bacterium]
MKIEFDPAKDAANRAKHGVPLTFGGEVLTDPLAVTMLDTRRVEIEDRYVVYGEIEGRVWCCVYTMRHETFRIISVRKANERETRFYRRRPR